jgi:hypothetical protein
MAASSGSLRVPSTADVTIGCKADLELETFHLEIKFQLEGRSPGAGGPIKIGFFDLNSIFSRDGNSSW